MQKIYLSQNEINELKSDLLLEKKSNSQKSFNSSISHEFYKIRNKEICIDFKENVRNILTIFYKWKNIPLSRKFIYCEINIDGKIDIITSIKPKQILINDKIVSFIINSDKSLDIITNEVTQKIKAQQQSKQKIFEKEIIIDVRKEVEIDGIYENANFDKFDNNEITFLYKNTHNIEISSFDKAFLEIKLNREKINELLLQLLRDKKLLENLTDDNFLYVGIINSKKVNYEIIKKFKNDYKDLNFIIIGINDSKLCQKDLNKYHDWEEIVKMQEVKKDMREVKKDIKDINIRLEAIEKKLGEAISLFKRGKNKAKLRKKRKRENASNSDEPNL